VKMDGVNLRKFQETVWNHYREHGRSFPWRTKKTAYRVLVSEIMLQQTQADRVVPYFERFMERFPDAGSLARARLSSVLKLWSGLGYNRRAKFLHDAAKAVVRDFSGVVPNTEAELLKLPGVGPYTAAAVAAFAGNQPSIVIETNIRSVFIHECFGDREGVTDAEILPLIEATVDRENPREWYQALMDYGAHLKKQGINPSRRSAHYVRQSKFEGSPRQARGRVLAALGRHGVSENEVPRLTGLSTERARAAVRSLVADGLVRRSGDSVRLP
jgi:A/G-specific adenine glycosylase